LFVPTHDTLARAERLPRFGLAMIDHLLPFQRSTKVLPPEVVPEVPTAKQTFALGHDTPPSELVLAPVRFGLGSTAQPLPLHRSINVLWPEAPTATQSCEVRHVTAFRVPARVVATIDHFVPFHRSTSVLLPESPTAKHIFVVGHATLFSSFNAPGPFGLATMDQLDPFQRSINVLVTDPLKKLPTAKQRVALAHDTCCNPLWEPLAGPATSANEVVPFPCSTKVA
jgi:hypothetical protein